MNAPETSTATTLLHHVNAFLKWLQSAFNRFINYHSEGLGTKSNNLIMPLMTAVSYDQQINRGVMTSF